jgi:hypothetical protein
MHFQVEIKMAQFIVPENIIFLYVLDGTRIDEKNGFVSFATRRTDIDHVGSLSNGCNALSHAITTLGIKKQISPDDIRDIHKVAMSFSEERSIIIKENKWDGERNF